MVEIYDSKRAAAALKITERTLQKWAAAGRVRFETIEKDGRQKRLYNGEDILRLKAESETGRVVPKQIVKSKNTNAAEVFQNAVGPDAFALFRDYVAVEVKKPVAPAENALSLAVVSTMNKDRDAFLKALDVQSQQHAKTLEAVLGTVLDRVFAAQKADREESNARKAHA